MNGLEDMNETSKPANHTPAIAMCVAAILVLIIAGMSYRDYVRKTMEKEFAEKEEARFAKYGQPQQSYQGQAPAFGHQAPQYPRDQRGNQYAQNTAVAKPAPQPVQTSQQADPSRIPEQSNLPSPRDSEIARLEENLAKAKARAQETERKYNELTQNTEIPKPATPPPSSNKLSPSLQSALENPPGGNPEILAELAIMRKKVLSSPSIGKVISYDKDWGIVTFNAGSSNGVKQKQRFAVRRGNDILGWVKVDEVHQTQSIAHMVTGNAKSDMTLKPQAGDDLIQFEL